MRPKIVNIKSIVRVLEQEGFRLEQLSDNRTDAEALFTKPRPDETSIYVTLSLGCDCITEKALHRIMTTAGIGLEKYLHLLK